MAVTFLRGLLYAAVTPPWQVPDEPGHFEYVWLLAHSPAFTDIEPSPALERELLASLYEWRYGELTDYPLPETMPDRLEDLPSWIAVQRSRPVVAGRFSLAYLWPALFLLPIRFQDLVVQLYAARLSSILLNVAIVWLAYRIFTDLVPGRPSVAALMATVIVFVPQHTFINSGVGDGPFAELMATIVLYAWVCLFRRGFSIIAVLAVLVGTAAAIWSKATAAFWVPLDVGLGLWWVWRQRHREWQHRWVVFASLIAVLVVATVFLWFQSSIGEYVTSAIQQSLPDGPLLTVDRRGLSVWQALLIAHDSFWAWFGWFTVPIGERWYGATLLLTVLAGAGWLLGRKSISHAGGWVPALMASVVVAAALVFLWVAILNSSSGYFQFQGRYLFPAIVPFAFLLAGGWLRVFRQDRQQLLAASGLLALILLDTWSLFGYLVPYFHS